MFLYSLQPLAAKAQGKAYALMHPGHLECRKGNPGSLKHDSGSITQAIGHKICLQGRVFGFTTSCG